MGHVIQVEEKITSVSLDTLREGEFAVVVSGSQAVGQVVIKTGTSAVSLADGTFIESSWATNVRKLVPGSKFTVDVSALINLTFAQRAVVRDFLDRNEKINAIKHVRSITNAGLKEAKDYVDNLG